MLVLAPTLIQTLLATVTKIVSSMGPMMVKYVPMVIETIGKNLPKVIDTVDAISLAVDVLRPNERAEELGAKALAADKKPEDFDQINDYIEYLRNDVEVDSNSLSSEPVDVLTRQAVGATIAIKGVGESLGTDVSLPFLNAVGRLGLDPKLVIEIIKVYAESGLSADDVGKYLENKLSISETHRHSDAWVNAYQEANPSMSIEEAEDAIMDIR